MTRAEVTELLRLRYEATKERWGDETIDAWQDWLGDLHLGDVRRRLRELVRGGATKIPIGLLVQGLAHDPPSGAMSHGCEHEGVAANGRTEWSCPRCGETFLAWNHPRAQAAFRRGYLEATGREWHPSQGPRSVP